MRGGKVFRRRTFFPEIPDMVKLFDEVPRDYAIKPEVIRRTLSMKKITFAAAAAVTLVASAASAGHLNLMVEGASFSPQAITFPSIMMDKPGYVVLHAVKNGKPVIPASIGHTALGAGTTQNVKVMVDGNVMRGEGYVAMLHYETNGNGTYDFGAGNTSDDGPATKADGAPYVIKFRTAM